MNFLKIKLNDFGYSYEYASNREMCILCNFLATDVRCYDSIYKEWAMADKLDPDSTIWVDCWW